MPLESVGVQGSQSLEEGLSINRRLPSHAATDPGATRMRQTGLQAAPDRPLQLSLAEARCQRGPGQCNFNRCPVKSLRGDQLPEAECDEIQRRVPRARPSRSYTIDLPLKRREGRPS